MNVRVNHNSTNPEQPISVLLGNLIYLSPPGPDNATGKTPRAPPKAFTIRGYPHSTALRDHQRVQHFTCHRDASSGLHAVVSLCQVFTPIVIRSVTNERVQRRSRWQKARDGLFTQHIGICSG